MSTSRPVTNHPLTGTTKTPREEDGGWGPLGDGSYKLLPIID